MIISNLNLIIKAIQKIYPTLEGGYSYNSGETNFTEALRWESLEFAKPTWEQIEPLLPEIELEEAKEAKKNTLLENYNVEIAKPHPIAKAPKLDKLNKPIGFTDAEFRISNPDILKQETTIVFGGLFLSILKYLELLNPKHAEMMTQALNSSIPIPYSTKNKKSEEVKIALTGIENFDIFKHLFVRISAKSSQLDLIKNQIENAKTPEELEKINVNF
jgi:hypothetical protein